MLGRSPTAVQRKAGSNKIMEITLIICTRNRAASLSQTLNSLNAATQSHRGDIDLLIVDNGSTDNTREVIAAWAPTAPLPVEVVFQPRRGLSAARNAGIAAARGRLLAFIDDDCAPEPGYVDDILRHYSGDTAPVIRGGRVELGNPEDLPYTIKISKLRERMSSDTHPGLLVLGCNMVIPRVVTQSVGWFDEQFGAGARFQASEESDYIYRAYCAGIEVEYVPDMAVRHFHGRRTLDDIARLSVGYFVGNGALYAKHFKNPTFARRLWRHTRMAVNEFFGGQTLDAKLGLTYRRLAFFTIFGMAMYWFRSRRKQ
jgi:glycosyltransferase involved in cell wall biosynthesis